MLSSATENNVVYLSKYSFSGRKLERKRAGFDFELFCNHTMHYTNMWTPTVIKSNHVRGKYDGNKHGISKLSALWQYKICSTTTRNFERQN